MAKKNRGGKIIGSAFGSTRYWDYTEKTVFPFPLQWMGYVRGDTFYFASFDQNLSPRSYPIHCEMKWKYSFLSVGDLGEDEQEIFEEISDGDIQNIEREL